MPPAWPLLCLAAHQCQTRDCLQPFPSRRARATPVSRRGSWAHCLPCTHGLECHMIGTSHHVDGCTLSGPAPQCDWGASCRCATRSTGTLYPDVGVHQRPHVWPLYTASQRLGFSYAGRPLRKGQPRNLHSQRDKPSCVAPLDGAGRCSGLLSRRAGQCREQELGLLAAASCLAAGVCLHNKKTMCSARPRTPNGPHTLAFSRASSLLPGKAWAADSVP